MCLLEGVLLTAAGVVEELGGRKDPARGRRQETRAFGLDQRVVDLLLKLLLRELRLRVEEDQLPPPSLLHLRWDILVV